MNKDRYVFILSKKTDIRIGGQSEVSLLEREKHSQGDLFEERSLSHVVEVGSHL